MSAFINPELLGFLTQLKSNNNKVWFEENKKKYTELREEYVGFMDSLLLKVRGLEDIPLVEAKKTVFRIYRDVRFAKDKTPYKINISSIIDRGPSWYFKCSFYIHIEPGASFIAGGVWEPSPAALKAIRQEIDYNPLPLLAILNSENFKRNFGKMEGDKLIKAPKDYPADHPNIDLLKHKQLIISKKLSDTEILAPDFQAQIFELYKNALPFFNYFDVVLKEISEEAKK